MLLSCTYSLILLVLNSTGMKYYDWRKTKHFSPSSQDIIMRHTYIIHNIIPFFTWNSSWLEYKLTNITYPYTCTICSDTYNFIFAYFCVRLMSKNVIVWA